MSTTDLSTCHCCSLTGMARGEGDPSPYEAALQALFDKVCNWGRWGEDDQRGTLNHIGPGEIAHAAAQVGEGRSISLSRPFPTRPGPENPLPAQHFMMVTGEDRHTAHLPNMEAAVDYIGIAFHGLVCTHLDALCHIFRGGRMYNGRPASEVRSRGAMSNSVMSSTDGIVGRGVLLDMPLALGLDYLEPDRLITVDELQMAENKFGVTVMKGDILTVRTGRDVRPGGGDGRIAGLHPHVAGWLHEREVALLGGDGPNDPMPPNAESSWANPIHELCLVAMGMQLMDNLDLERAARTCKELGRWTFQIVIAPLPIEGATGSPINPIAIF